MTARKATKPLMGNPLPRLAPPTPARTRLKEFTATAEKIGVHFLPWQVTASRYIYALGQQDRWLYPEVAVIVGRQSGKTLIIKPHVVERLAMGRKILHAAQTRELPRKMFMQLVPIVEHLWPDAKIRKGAGQETIEVPSTGGLYVISAASSGGPRGLTIDDLIADELRELDEDFFAAAESTTAASANPQWLYLSNAGSDDSVVLNGVRSRADTDPALAYLEWSAGPDRAVDDVQGWADANPAIGHFPMLLDNLARMYQSHKLSGRLATFETENLCRWVVSLKERLVDDTSWAACAGPLGQPTRPSIGIALDPDGKRAAIALAWMVGRKVALQLVENVTGDPVDTDSVGELLKLLAMRHNAKVGFELEDSQLMKYVKKEKGVAFGGGRAKAASAEFARLVAAGDLIWANCDPVTDDLTWTARKQDHDGTYEAVRAKDDHPIPAALAAIRAVYMASLPQSEGRLVVR